MIIKTRFAPSPTGWLHIGGVRTALYSWLYAKKNNGKFYLRIDDTDTTRSTDEYKNSIISALTQLGLKHDDEITYQSNRFDHYIDKIEELLNKDMAYYDKVEVNEKTKETDLSVQYENRLNKEGYVIRFKNQKESSIAINDSVHGEITFDPKVFFDVVILRSNGVPTYNLTSVVDDIDLGITHLIRGDDHLSNLPVQVNLFTSAISSPVGNLVVGNLPFTSATNSVDGGSSNYNGRTAGSVYMDLQASGESGNFMALLIANSTTAIIYNGEDTSVTGSANLIDASTYIALGLTYRTQ